MTLAHLPEKERESGGKAMSAHLKLVELRNENRSVPVRPPNSELRTREYLTPAEVEKLIKAAKDGAGGIGTRRWYWLPSGTACGLQKSATWSGRRSSSAEASLHVRRAKNGKPSVHPLRPDRLAARCGRHHGPVFIAASAPDTASSSPSLLSGAGPGGGG